MKNIGLLYKSAVFFLKIGQKEKALSLLQDAYTAAYEMGLDEASEKIGNKIDALAVEDAEE